MTQYPKTVVNQPRRRSGRRSDPGRRSDQPPSFAGGPTGLGALAGLDQVYIYQKLDVFELITGFECENEYYIMNSNGQVLYLAQEDSGFLSRYCCTHCRAFEMSVYDIRTRQEVCRFNKHFGCSSGLRNCFWCCCLHQTDVLDKSGNYIGAVKHRCGCIPRFDIMNANQERIFKVTGPCSTCSCCGTDVPFDIVAVNGGDPIGTITKVWGGFLREMLSDADIYEITFPRDMDVLMKAVLIGAGVLVDYAYFENEQKQGLF